MKFSWIEENSSVYPAKKMCQVLNVSRSGYYHWLQRPPSARSQEDAELLTSIRQIHQESHGAYGTPRILEVLRKRGRRVGKNRIDRLKRHAAIFARKFRHYRVATTDSKHDQQISPNLLNQDFKASRPNRVWLSDITYIRLATGAFVYLCVVLDLFSREIAGWNLASHMRTELVLGALNQAVCRRRPSSGLIFHSDRGVQYASKDFRKELKRGRFRQSMSRKGNCYNNAPMESFFAMLKIEEIYRTSYESLAAAKRKLFDYIKVFYNRQRRHSALGCLAPKKFSRKQEAA